MRNLNGMRNLHLAIACDSDGLTCAGGRWASRTATPHSGRAGLTLQLARRLSLCAWHEAGGGREQEEAVGALRPEVDDARLARP